MQEPLTQAFLHGSIHFLATLDADVEGPEEFGAADYSKRLLRSTRWIPGRFEASVLDLAAVGFTG